MAYSHQPVMTEEIIHYLNPQLGDLIIDCTLGGGGHSKEFLKRVLPQGKVLGIDLDPLAIKAARQETKNSSRLVIAKDNFKNLKKIADVHQFDKVNGILFDLGLSSGQLQDQSRGFSFLADGSLDMRFGAQTDLTAEQILNNYSQKELSNIFKTYGEEKLASLISKKIIEIRKQSPITSPNQLVEVITEIYKRKYKGKSKVNPATKVFQALRIVVNQELENLKQALPAAVDLLTLGGHIAVISYHSLEDKIVKEFFKEQSKDCICPPKTPVCQCNHKKSLKIITKKPVVPSDAEIVENPRSRSAKLRVAQKI